MLQMAFDGLDEAAAKAVEAAHTGRFKISGIPAQFLSVHVGDVSA